MKYKDMTATEIRNITFENCPYKCSCCEKQCEQHTVAECRKHLSDKETE